MTSRGSGHNYIDVLDSLLEPDDFVTAPSVAGRRKKLKLMGMVQLCLLPMILDLQHNNAPLVHWDSSQRYVYSHHGEMQLFKGFYRNHINIKLLVNTLNYFKFHLKVANGEGILSNAYAKLASSQRPQMWIGKVPVGTQDMKGHWKGVASKLATIRR